MITNLDGIAPTSEYAKIVKPTITKPSIAPSPVSVDAKPKKSKIWIDPRRVFISKLILHVE